MNTNNNDDWCHYSGMPSPMAYINNNTMKVVELSINHRVIEHKTYEDNRGSYTPIQTNELGIEWEQCSISINDKKEPSEVYTIKQIHHKLNTSKLSKALS